jgi:glycine/D-amino acid oxidase-like deaminating enzyme
MPIRNLPYWLDRFPKSRRPSYPRLQGNLETTVAIVGGGLTGCSCAWSFAAAGVKVVLLEAEAIGGGATARGIGLVREDFDASFQETTGLHGLRSARALWQAMRRASLDYPAAIRRLQIRCDLAPSDLLLFAKRPADTRLQREYHSRRAAGLDHSWVTPAMLARQTGVEGGAAIRTRGAVLDPYRACVAFAAAATDRGAVLHAKSPVRRIRAGRKQVEIATDAGTVRADSVIIATGAPLADLRALRRHLKARHGYAVVTGSLPASVRREVGTRAAAMRDSDVPPHFLRWMRDDRVMFSGADQPEVAPRASDKALVQRTGQLMYELSTLYPAVSGVQADWAWDFTHYETVDRLPFGGPHRNFPRHLFAMGAGRHGAGFAWLAARILLRQHQGEPARGDELFGFTRIL